MQKTSLKITAAI